MSSNKTINLIGGKPWGFRIIGGNDTMLPLQIQQVNLKKNNKILKRFYLKKHLMQDF